jgi:signal transduction histidine kinase
VRTTIIAAVAVVAAGMTALQVVMQPSSGDRLEPFALFGVMALFTIAAAAGLPRIAARTRSLGRTVAAVGLVASALVVLGVAAGAWRMFLSVHDLHLLTVMLAVAAGLGTVFAISAARPLRHDLDAIRHTADRVTTGDLTARTGVTRADELGATAAALDSMIERLAAAEDHRRHDDEVRQTLLAAIGHDLRTPLGALQAAVEALEDGLTSDTSRYLRSMSRDLAHLRALVDDLFLLARIEAGELAVDRQTIDLAEIADETVEAMTPVANGSDVALHLQGHGPVLAHGRPEALGRVMRNLVDNAIRHAPTHSRVVVRVTNGEDATVEVLDQGPGFDAEILAAAFDRFTRGEPSRSRDTGGTGLGLAIAKGVIEAHGGAIWAEPGPGGYVAFRIPTGRPHRHRDLHPSDRSSMVSRSAP